MRRICNDRTAGAGTRRAAAAVLAAMLAVAVPAVPAFAQGSDPQALGNQIERLQQELNTLQQYVYRGGGAGAAAGGASGSTRPMSGEAASPAAVAQLSVRLNQLQSEIQRLTGQNEEFGHSIRQMQARLDKLVTDVDTRLSALERRAGVTPNAQNAGNGAAAPTDDLAAGQPAQRNEAAQQNQPSEGELAPGPQVIGQLRADQAGGQPAGGAAAAPPPPQQAATPKETPEQLYARAKSLLLKEQDVVGAERLLREFIDKYPDNSYAAGAHYWLGRTYFVRKDYKQAAFTFAEAFQKYPKSSTAPADLLNLGMSLQQLGKIKEACTAYSRLLQNFPKADDSIKRRATSERQRAKCG
jgi:tol-pal system protein YbgF